MASALVLLMTPGLGFFYGGMVRVKNVISTVSRSGSTSVIVVVVVVAIFPSCLGRTAAVLT